MIRADKRKYHYIYKITRVDGKFYIGMHSTENVDDNYFGSGKLITRSIKKHGLDKHAKEILEYLPCRLSLKLREQEMVSQEIVDDPLCMNLQLGGGGGFSTWHQDESNARNFHRAGQKAMLLVKDHSASSKLAWSRHREVYSKSLKECGFSVKGNVAACLPSAIEKKRATMLERQHQVGEKNSQFGTRWSWIHNDHTVIKIKKTELDEYLARGYSLGQKPNLIKIEKLDEKILEYKRLMPLCRNTECSKLLSVLQFRKNISSCSKSCSNKTRKLK